MKEIDSDQAFKHPSFVNALKSSLDSRKKQLEEKDSVRYKKFDAVTGDFIAITKEQRQSAEIKLQTALEEQ